VPYEVRDVGRGGGRRRAIVCAKSLGEGRSILLKKKDSRSTCETSGTFRPARRRISNV